MRDEEYTEPLPVPGEAQEGMDCGQLTDGKLHDTTRIDRVQHEAVGRQSLDLLTHQGVSATADDSSPFNPDQHLQVVELEDDDTEDDSTLARLGAVLRADPDCETPEEKLREVRGIWRTLLALGASEVEAKDTLVEVYSPPRVSAVAAEYPRYKIGPGGTYDLRPGRDGASWDFT